MRPAVCQSITFDNISPFRRRTIIFSAKQLPPRLYCSELEWRMARVTPIALILITLLASRALAQEHQHLKSEKLGTVHFATSCNEAAQQEFDRAAALLHSFQFSRAIEGFNAVLAKD